MVPRDLANSNLIPTQDYTTWEARGVLKTKGNGHDLMKSKPQARSTSAFKVVENDNLMFIYSVSFRNSVRLPKSPSAINCKLYALEPFNQKAQPHDVTFHAEHGKW